MESTNPFNPDKPADTAKSPEVDRPVDVAKTPDATDAEVKTESTEEESPESKNDSTRRLLTESLERAKEAGETDRVAELEKFLDELPA